MTGAALGRLGSASVALTAVAMVVGGGAILGAALAWWPGLPAFRAMLVATLVAAVASVLGGLALWRSGGARALRPHWPVPASTLVSAIWVFAVLSRVLAAIGAPLINDISTDLADPPAFVPAGLAAQWAAGAGQSLAYPGERFAEQQRRSYPGLGTLRLESDLGSARDRVRAVMERLGWKEAHAAADGTHLEAVVTSRLFRFVDDVAVRLRADAHGVAVDVRSRSRVGRGDLGANAARIEAFLAALEG